MRCRRFRSASLWLLLVPLRVVVAAGGEHSPSIAASAAWSLPTGTIVCCLSLSWFVLLKGKEAGSRWLEYVRTRQQDTSSHVWLFVSGCRTADRSVELLNKGGPPRLPTRLGVGCDCEPRRRRRHTAAAAAVLAHRSAARSGREEKRRMRSPSV